MKLHFLIHEKVTFRIIENFSKACSKDIFIVTYDDSITKPAYPKSVFTIQYRKLENKAIDVLRSFDVDKIVFHSLNLNFSKLILNPVFSKRYIVWVIWGFDLYNLPKIRKHLLMPITKQVYCRERKSYKLFWIKFKLSNRFKTYPLISMFFGEIKQYKIIEDSLKNVDAIATYIKQDYEYFVHFYGGNMGFNQLRFMTINQYINIDLISKEENRDALWIGNSNSYENNYFDCMDWVAQRNILCNKIYVPLSYGINDFHKNAVCEIGYNLFEGKFKPLLDFLDFNEYTKILNEVRVALFFHSRQQAMGTIISMLYSGVTVIMSEGNPGYHFFRDIGVNLWAFEFVDNSLPQITKNQATHNKRVLADYFKEDHVLSDMKML